MPGLGLLGFIRGVAPDVAVKLNDSPHYLKVGYIYNLRVVAFYEMKNLGLNICLCMS